jgi:hypothetical protein
MNTNRTAPAPFEPDGFVVTNLFGELVRFIPTTSDADEREDVWFRAYETYDPCRTNIVDTRDEIRWREGSAA